MRYKYIGPCNSEALSIEIDILLRDRESVDAVGLSSIMTLFPRFAALSIPAGLSAR